MFQHEWAAWFNILTLSYKQSVSLPQGIKTQHMKHVAIKSIGPQELHILLLYLQVYIYQMVCVKDHYVLDLHMYQSDLGDSLNKVLWQLTFSMYSNSYV